MYTSRYCSFCFAGCLRLFDILYCAVVQFAVGFSVERRHNRLPNDCVITQRSVPVYFLLFSESSRSHIRKSFFCAF